MSFLQSIFRSKLNLLVLVIFPIVIIVSLSVWTFLSYPERKSDLETETIQSAQSIVTDNSDQSSNSISTTSSNKKDSTEASFDDLDSPKPKDKIVASSVIALTSPIASTPDLDAAEILGLLDTIDQLGSSDDASLDNQILEN